VPGHQGMKASKYFCGGLKHLYIHHGGACDFLFFPITDCIGGGRVKGVSLDWCSTGVEPPGCSSETVLENNNSFALGCDSGECPGRGCW